MVFCIWFSFNVLFLKFIPVVIYIYIYIYISSYLFQMIMFYFQDFDLVLLVSQCSSFISTYFVYNLMAF